MYLKIYTYSRVHEMKIYNKITMGWNDSTQTYDIVVDEDAFEYDGEIYELQTRECPNGAGPCNFLFADKPTANMTESEWPYGTGTFGYPEHTYPEYCKNLCKEAYEWTEAHPDSKQRFCDAGSGRDGHWAYRNYGNSSGTPGEGQPDNNYWRVDFCACGCSDETIPCDLDGGMDLYWYFYLVLGLDWGPWVIDTNVINTPGALLAPGPHVTYYFPHTDSNYTASFTFGANTCTIENIDFDYGCVDEEACNYAPWAVNDQGDCLFSDCNETILTGSNTNNHI
jgi:hypothetical protein